MNKALIFKPRARLLLQLGDQLIRNENIAIIELVKNSYDADAENAFVTMEKVNNTEVGKIIIEDDGIGMDIDIIKNVWLEPGSDYKAQKIKELYKTPRFNRMPIGEKGIGRFGVHKLGNKIQLITRMKNKKEVYLKINWEIFNQYKYLDEINLDIKEREPLVFPGNKHGTKIIVENLKSPWTKMMIREVYRAINSLNSPFEKTNPFNVKLTIDDPSILKGLIDVDAIRDYSLYRFKCRIKGNEIFEFDYKFIPLPSMQELKPRHITINNKEVKEVRFIVDREDNEIDLSNYNIGVVDFEGLISDRDPKILNLGIQDKKGLKTYLDENGGIKVYRNGIRIYDYGEPENDWLNLDYRRVNVPGKRISNNIILAAINLRRKESTELIEKTNREGFVENEAYRALVSVILYVINIVETLRHIDKSKVREIYGPKSKKEPVIDTINDLRIVIEDSIKNTNLKIKINNYLKRIEDEFEQISNVLLKTAGAGLSLTVALHEIEKIIEELKHVVEKQKPSERILKLVERLFEIVEAYSQLAKGRGKKKEDLVNLIDNALFAVEYRLEVHNIQVLKLYKEFTGNKKVQCERSLIIGAILNLIDNSIWWLEYYKIKDKKIIIDAIESPKYLSILFADNGKGFTLPTQEIIKPFVSAKPYGMGIGLHLVHEIISSHNGILDFPKFADTLLPDDFRKGAIVLIKLQCT